MSDKTLGELLREKLSQWDKDVGAHPNLKEQTTVNQPAKPYLFQPTNNVSRATFEAVRMHYGMDRKSITKILTDKGFNANSVSSIITQMIHQELVRVTMHDGRAHLYPNVPSYVPLKTHKTLKNKQQKEQPRKVLVVPSKTNKEKDAGIAALPSAATAPVIQSTWDAATIIDHLSLRQARALYDELAKVFGGK